MERSYPCGCWQIGLTSLLYTLSTIEARTGTVIETPHTAEEICERMLACLIKLDITSSSIESRCGVDVARDQGLVDIALNINELDTTTGITLWARLLGAAGRP